MNLRDLLRTGTADLHAELDVHVRSRGYLATLDGFRDFLVAALAFHSAAERVMTEAQAQRWIPDWPSRERLALLHADLAVLGLDAVDTAANTQRALNLLSAPPSAELVLGLGYVLEGSTLGAAVVLRDVAPLGVTAGRGASFLDSAQGPPRRWASFLDIVSAREAEVDAAATLSAARAAFSAARLCFD